MKYSLFKESKNYQPLYHILDLDKLKYVIENNHLKPHLARIPAEHIRLSNKHVYDYKELFK